MTTKRLSFLFASVATMSLAGMTSIGCGMYSTSVPSGSGSNDKGTEPSLEGTASIATGNGELVLNYDVVGGIVRGVDLSDIDVSEATQLNIGAIAVIDGQCVASQAVLDVLNSDALATVRAQNPALSIVLSVGGESTYAELTNQVAAPEKRDAFLASCIGLMKDHGLSGIDLNFDHLPSGSSCSCEQGNGQSLIDLVQALRDKLDAQQTADNGEKYVLSLQLSSDPSVLATLDLSVLHPSLTHLDVKAYDLNGSWEKITNLGAPLHSCDNDPSSDRDTRTVSAVLQEMLDGGVPANKLILGLAFEGQAWMGVPPLGNGLYQISLGKAQGTRIDGLIDYAQIVANVELKPSWSDQGQMSWAYGATGIMVSFEDDRSIAAKIDYAAKLGLGGVMIREVGCDGKSQPLLHAVVDKLRP